MAFDIEMIKEVYARMADRVDTARGVVGKPLTLAEKILYNQLKMSLIYFAYILSYYF